MTEDRPLPPLDPPPDQPAGSPTPAGQSSAPSWYPTAEPAPATATDPLTSPAPTAEAPTTEAPATEPPTGPDLPTGEASAGGGPTGGTEAPGQPDEPPPLTAFAWRNRLVRPKQGRMAAGVCGAFARATDTDPVLWRVIIAVLTIFAGIGFFAYLIAWLILPADGDTASPVEALAGRGKSATSRGLTIFGIVIVVLGTGTYFSEPFHATPLLGVLLLGGALLLLLRDRQRGRGGPVTAVSPPTFAAAAPAAEAGTSTAAFAPHGPYASATTPPYGIPPVPPVPPVPPLPRPRRPRSRLGRLTFSIILITIGAMALFDLAELEIETVWYLAAALLVVGLGLVVGTWFGRARGLIAVGILLSLLLLTAEGVEDVHPWRGGTVTWAPSTVSDLRPTYHHEVGDATLDLSAIDFASLAGPVDVNVNLDMGNLRIILPPRVDATIDATVDIGNADVFDQNWGGLGMDKRSVTDLGMDGPGGGKVNIRTTVSVGNLEVER